MINNNNNKMNPDDNPINPIKENIAEKLLNTSNYETIRKNFSSMYLKKNLIVPFILADNEYLLAITRKTKNDVISDVSLKLDIRNKKIIILPSEELIDLINAAYDTSMESIKGINDRHTKAGEFSSNGSLTGETDEFENLKSFEHIDLIDENSDAPAIKFINTIILEAVKENASDIHIEPFQDYLLVKFRIDGSLTEKLRPQINLKDSIVSRIKVMSGLDIAEKRLPQDGRIQLVARNRNIDIRVSIVPTIFGERVVLRLLDKSLDIYDITEVGIDEKFIPLVKNSLAKSTGMIISTGPTGSGKTTTLYSFINEVIKLFPDKNVLTIEDPVEYQIKGISQINVNNKIGLTFAKGLRHILRQDPDIIMIGEIRDSETAEIAIQSAMTGHLVFSTLHTNDSASSFARLTDMEIEPFLIASSITIVFAQRLLRKLCPFCKKSYILNDENIRLLANKIDIDADIYTSGDKKTDVNCNFSIADDKISDTGAGIYNNMRKENIEHYNNDDINDNSKNTNIHNNDNNYGNNNIKLSKELLNLAIIKDILKDGDFYISAGCKECGLTGYKGRTAIYEILEVNDEIRSLVMLRASSQEIKSKAIENGMSTLRIEAIKKFAAGTTSLAEVIRVSEED
ncbi:MAG: GspE/PulE family protein [bacterium]